MIPSSLSFKINLGLASLTVLPSLLSSPQAYAMEMDNSNPEPVALKPSLTPIDSKAQPLTPEYVKERISKANGGNREAQDEVVNLYDKGSYREFLKPEMFATWENIQERCYENDKYAFFVIRKKNFEAIGGKFPDLLKIIGMRAKQGHAGAEYNFSCVYKYGLGGLFKNNIEEADRFCKLAADKGNAHAQCNVGFNHLNYDLRKATTLFKRAADQGYLVAQYNLGVMHKNLGNDKEAVFYFRLAGSHGYASALVGLAIMYENGLGGLVKDEKEAVRLYQLALDQTDDDAAQCNLGVMYEHGRGGLIKDAKKAVDLYKLSAAQGNAAAQSNLGKMYHYGHGGLKKDLKEAIRLYKLAADQKTTVAQEKLKLIYQESLDKLDKNEEEAIYLLTLLADQEYADAQKKCNDIYQACISGLEKDKKKAILLLTLLADQGYTDTQKKLGMMYADGCRIEKNYQEALRWLMKSKHLEAKNKIYFLLGTPRSFGEKKYSFDGKKDYVGSFKDMLDHILFGKRLDDSEIQTRLDKLMAKDERGWSHQPQSDLLMGLGSLTYTHQIKKNTKNSSLCLLYTKVEAVEAELLDIITSLKESSGPGFMIPVFKGANDEVLKEFRNSLKDKGQPRFFAEYSIERTTDSWFKPVITDHYYSFGEQNVSLSEKVVQCLTTIDKRWEEADKALKEIAFFYQKALKPDQKEFDDLPDALSCGQSEQARMMRQAKNDAEKEQRSLENIKNNIQAFLYFGKSTRAWEFFEENQWLK